MLHSQPMSMLSGNNLVFRAYVLIVVLQVVA